MDKRLKFIDLFAGIGGFHLALHQLGCECVFASEIDEAARVTYERNFYGISPQLFDSGNFNDDIRKVSPHEIPDFDILCAGFPCQPFSQAGFKKGFLDGDNSERGNLFFNIADILAAKQPKAFFLENVRGIVNHDGGRTLKIIRDVLQDELGYSFYLKIVKASDYGLPQHRPRAFMIGFRDEGILQGFEYPPTIPLKFDMSDVFGGNCTRKIGFTLRVGGAGSGLHDRRNWDSYLVNGDEVRIQPPQAAKIQGFPQSYKLPNSRSEAMKQLGNSVAVDAVRECGRAVIEHIDRLAARQLAGDNVMQRSRNKGEWTELYTFLKLMSERHVRLSDETLEATGDVFEVSSITTHNIPQKIEIKDNGFTIVSAQGVRTVTDTEIFAEVKISEIADAIKAGSATFSVPMIDDIFKRMGVEVIRGGTSNQKSDIILDFSFLGNQFSEQGMGIKSYLGSSPTLLNASGSNTNFIYKVSNCTDEILASVNKINSKTKIKDRLERMLSLGCDLSFQKVEADTMNYNLHVIDQAMPSLMASMLLNFYLRRQNSIAGNLHDLHKRNYSDASDPIDEDANAIKIKRFLVAVLLGLFSGKKWDGKFTSNGAIVVKADGSQVCFHIVKLDILESYLFNSVRFDTPSSTRHRFGSVYKERDGDFYFKLNMQLRFH